MGSRGLMRRLRKVVPRRRILRDPGELALYDSDGLCLHRSVPGGVVLAESAGEVQGVVRALVGAGVPFVARGAGTGLSGGAVPLEGAWVIDVHRLRRVLEINPLDRYAIVEPGVVNLDLDHAAARHGLRFAPDPSSEKACTVGGNIAENSGGPHCFLHGMTTRHILGVTMVLPSGELLELGGPPGSAAGNDWRGVFVGAEGTFGVTVRAVVALIPRPPEVRTWLAAFPSLAAACRAVTAIIAAGLRPAALEILDRLAIQAVEASVYHAGYPQDAQAVLLIEEEGWPEEIEAEAPVIGRAVEEQGALTFEEARDDEARERLWRGRKGAFGAMGRIDTDLYVLDGVVPRRRLAEAVERIAEIGRRRGVTLSNVFHAGDGNLHPNISFDGRDPAQRERVVAAGAEILRLCIELGGTLSGEHGIGVEKREFMPLIFDDDDLDTQRCLRRGVDPGGLANPGKILPEGRGCVESGWRGPGHAARVQRILEE
ncbi:MAG: FAD-binding oxidoreductase [Planctomycetota bacterium]